MKIEVELTQQQFVTLWKKCDLSTSVDTVNDRFSYWNKHFKSTYNIEYTEATDGAVADEPGNYPYAWFGVLCGEEKHINWFLLQL